MQRRKQKNTGILGGTFDPVHSAHLAIAKLAMAAAELDSVVFMPAGTPPHKDGRALTAAEHRLRMVRLAVEGIEGFQASDFEIVTPGIDYTANTLRAYGALHPMERLHFIIGGDSLLYLDQWRDPQALLRLARFIAVYRPGSSYEALVQKREEILGCFGGEILLVECPGQDTSSTDIRGRVAAGQPIDRLVPPAVERYIRSNGLYLEGK